VSGKRPARAVAVLTCWLAIASIESGCAFGPKVLEQSHGRYNEAVRHVSEEQLLRNLVHIRYNEPRVHLDVSSIAAQYELDAGAEARPFYLAPNPAGKKFHTFTSVLPDLILSGANRPTLTLIPADNGDAVQRFLTPITVETLTLLQETSWPVSMVVRLWIERLNGVPNAATASGPQQNIIPDFARFRRAVDLMQAASNLGLCLVRPEERSVEVSGPLPPTTITASSAVEAAKDGMEFRPRDDGTSWALFRKERRLVLEINPAALGHPVLEELTSLLNLEPGRLRYAIVPAPGVQLDPLQSPIPPSDELHVSLRSSSQVYFYLANGVEVPPEHLAAGLVRLPIGPDGRVFDGRIVTDGLFTVHAWRGHKPPPTAFVAIKYRGYWYYIDDRDQESKATFTLMLSLSRLDFGRAQPAAPFLTLPIGR
jgi:hypothetical protein